MKKQILLFLLVFISVTINAQIVVPLALPDNCNVGVGTEELKGEVSQNVTIYPNPSDGNFTINISYDKIIEEIDIIIYNSSGNECFTQPVYCDSKNLIKKIDVSELPSGVYFIKILSDNYELNSSFIIQK